MKIVISWKKSKFWNFEVRISFEHNFFLLFFCNFEHIKTGFRRFRILALTVDIKSPICMIEKKFTSRASSSSITSNSLVISNSSIISNCSVISNCWIISNCSIIVNCSIILNYSVGLWTVRSLRTVRLCRSFRSFRTIRLRFE